MNDLVFVTVSYYSGDHLDVMLTSIREQSDAPVLIANNAPGDDLSSFSSREGLSVIEIGHNVGYGGAIDVAVATLAVMPRWILIVNPDVSFQPGSIAELIDVSLAQGHVGVAGPLILTPAGDVYPSARRLPSLPVGIGHALLARAWPTNPWTRTYLEDRQEPRLRQAGWLSGSCLLVSGEAFAAVGGFDRKFFMYFEDVDLCDRIAQAGWQILYAPSSVVMHTGGHAALKEEVNRSMLIAHHRSAYVYLSARYGAWWQWPLRVALRIGLSIRGRIDGR